MFLSGTPGESKNQVYQLADPKPLKVEQMIQEMGRATRRRIIRIPLPLGWQSSRCGTCPECSG